MRRPKAWQDFSRSWHGVEAWNARMAERGYKAAMIEQMPFLRRLKVALTVATNGVRERWACRLAPWAIDASQYDQIVGR